MTPSIRKGTAPLLMLAVAAALVLSPAAAAAGPNEHQSGVFAGGKVNRGTVTHKSAGGREVLALSSDFVVPDTPDPHWQVVDSRGTVYLLEKLKVKGDAIKREIVLPEQVKDVAKVQIYCAWAETVLGEASFAMPVATASK